MSSDTGVSPAQGLTTFECFPTLPMELRLKIWGFALPSQRLLRVTAPNTCFQEVGRVTKKHEHQNMFTVSRSFIFHPAFQTNDTDIPMLRACWESRRVVLEAYPVCLPSISGTAEIRACSGDIIAISNLYTLIPEMIHAKSIGYTIPSYLSKLRYLAFYEDGTPSHHFESLYYFTDDGTRPDLLMEVFPELESIRLVCDTERQVGSDGCIDGFVSGERACDRMMGREQFNLDCRAHEEKVQFQFSCRRWTLAHGPILKFPDIQIMAKEPKSSPKPRSSMSLFWIRRGLAMLRRGR